MAQGELVIPDAPVGMAPHRFATRSAHLLLAVVALAGLLASGQPFCVHESEAPALYDAACPLEMVAHHADVSVSPSLPATWAGFVRAFRPSLELPAFVASVAFAQEYRAPPVV